MKSRSSPNQARASRHDRRSETKPPVSLPTARPWLRQPLGIIAAVLLLLGAGIGVWRWHQRAAPLPVDAAVAPSPEEARLLAAAARERGNPQPYLQLAEEYASSERPASALWAYGEAAARSPGDDTIRLKLAAVMTQMGDDRAAEALLRPVAAGSTPAAAQGRQDLAGLLLSTGRPAAALAILPEAATEAALRGRAHEAAGDDAAAAADYQRAGAAGDPEGYERLARLELARGRLPAAREAIRALGRLPDARPSVLLLIAAIHAASRTPQELDTALDRVRRCLELEPGSAEAHYQAGLLLARRGERAAAVDQLEQAVRLDPNHTAAHGRLADLLQAMGQTARAHRERASYYELKDEPDRALAELAQARTAGPGWETAASLSADDLAQAHLVVSAATEAGQEAGVIRQAQAGLERHPNDPGLMLQLGLLYRQRGSREALERLCRDWIARQPASGMPYWFLGDLALKGGRIADAIHSFQTACALEPNRADFCTALALAYVMAGGTAEAGHARSWLEKAIALNPRTAGPYEQLGQILQQAGSPDAARRCYLRSLDLQPDQESATNKLVRLLDRQGQVDAARWFAGLARGERERRRERYQLASRVRDNPALPGPCLELARFLIRNGQLEAARNQLERAAEAGAAAAPARRALAEVDRLLHVQASG